MKILNNNDHFDLKKLNVPKKPALNEMNLFKGLENSCLGYSFLKVIENKGLLNVNNEENELSITNTKIEISKDVQKKSENYLVNEKDHKGMIAPDVLKKYNLISHVHYSYQNIDNISSALKKSLGIHLDIPNTYLVHFQNNNNPDLNHTIAIRVQGKKYSFYDVNQTIENKSDTPKEFDSFKKLSLYIDENYNSYTDVFANSFSHRR